MGTPDDDVSSDVHDFVCHLEGISSSRFSMAENEINVNYLCKNANCEDMNVQNSVYASNSVEGTIPERE